MALLLTGAAVPGISGPPSASTQIQPLEILCRSRASSAALAWRRVTSRAYPLSGTATWDNTTISGLTLIPGSYTWSWGSGPSLDSFTVNIGVQAAQLPAVQLRSRRTGRGRPAGNGPAPSPRLTSDRLRFPRAPASNRGLLHARSARLPLTGHPKTDQHSGLLALGVGICRPCRARTGTRPAVGPRAGRPLGAVFWPSLDSALLCHRLHHGGSPRAFSWDRLRRRALEMRRAQKARFFRGSEPL